MNQGIQHPLASAWCQLEAAKLATYHAARLYDESGKDSTITQHQVGAACNSAKYLAAEAAFAACERAVSISHDESQVWSRLTVEGDDARRYGLRTGISCRTLLPGMLGAQNCTC